MTLHATSQSDSEQGLPQERAKYAMVDYSELVVGTSIASYNLMHVSHGAVAVRCRATAPSQPSHLSMTLHATSQSDSEQGLPQERAECAMFDYSELVVGTSIASYDLMHVSHGAVAVRYRAPAPLPTLTPLHQTLPRDLQS